MTGQAPDPQCAFHPGRVAYVQCQRCGRTICPDCQVQAAVGVQCPACVHQAARAMPRARSVLGAPLGQGKPVITIAAIGLCALVYVLQQVVGDQFTVDYAFLPWYSRIEPYRLVTAAFCHGSVLHLLMNMYCLWAVGSFLEQILGRLRYATLFLISAIGGNLAVLAWARLIQNEDMIQLSLGASGAVFGLFAAYFVISRKLGGDITGIATVIGINLVLSFLMANVSWQAHVGGLLTGAALAAVYAYAPPARRRAAAWVGGIGGLVVVSLIWFALTR